LRGRFFTVSNEDFLFHLRFSGGIFIIFSLSGIFLQPLPGLAARQTTLPRAGFNPSAFCPSRYEHSEAVSDPKAKKGKDQINKNVLKIHG
jgi:hypothetical protein